MVAGPKKERKVLKMARILDAKCRICRREGKKLFLKGNRCYGSKCPIEKKGAVPPGFHGQKRLRKLSDYGIQLREKQKVKRTYGVTESQMKKYCQQAKKGIAKDMILGGTGERLLRLLEMRLDNVLFRTGLVFSRSVARQMINHGHVLVDGKKVNIPSCQIRLNQTINFTPKGLALDPVTITLEKKIAPAKWLEKKGAVVKVVRIPQRQEMEQDINEQLIVEFYSR